jgi:hypothetical protein
MYSSPKTNKKETGAWTPVRVKFSSLLASPERLSHLIRYFAVVGSQQITWP